MSKSTEKNSTPSPTLIPRVAKRSGSARKKLHDAIQDNPPPKVELTQDCYKMKGDIHEQLLRLAETFGNGDQDFIYSQVAHLTTIGTDAEQVINTNSMLAFIHNLEPRDAIESVLITQMTSVHQLAMACMARAAGSNDKDLTELKLNQANKLMRTFTTQMEALNRHRGKGQQKVTVEHVTVNSGGQAIVGTIGRSRQGEG